MPSQSQPADIDTKPLMTIGVIADTHIPDRVSTLHPQVIPALKAAGVEHILHAGDICVPSVLEELRQVAPVNAARGNRDLLMNNLHMVETVHLAGVEIAVMHGHGGFFFYFWDKWQFILFGYNIRRYLRLLTHTSGTAQVVVYGHTHHKEIIHKDGKLLFNPGPAGMVYDEPLSTSIGLLRIYPEQRVEAEIIALTGYQVRGRQWVAETE